MLLLDEADALTDQPKSAAFSSENEAQGGDSSGWQCMPPSTSPSGEAPSQPASGPPARAPAHSHSPPALTLSGTKKRSSKPAHLRRNIRKLLREHQLEAGTKAAQLEELERRNRLQELQRKDFPLPSAYSQTPGDSSLCASAQVSKRELICLDSSTGSSKARREQDAKSRLSAPTIKEDVIVLSSSEDDALHSSRRRAAAVEEDDDEEEEIEEEEEEVVPGTEEICGAHANDSLNQPDAQGRVLVNVNHPAEEADLFLSPQLARVVKPHQIGGIRFLYDNLVESQERFKSSSGFGCILAHSMGLGKTLQVISFIDILLRHTGAHTVLAIVPVNTLQNWLSEFNMWAPPAEALPPDTDPAHVAPRTFKVHILNDEHKSTAARAKVVEDWHRDGGVLLMGYEMYRLLSLKKSFVAGRKKKAKKPSGPVVIDLDEEDRQQELLKGIERALSQPGPDVVICDEGHRIKNCHASTSQALKGIRTRRRVVLTGYPLQNNLIEYWCMVDFVRPDFLGTRQEFSNMFERPILNGQCADSTVEDLRLMRYRSHVLHSLLEGFVQRRGHDVLRSQLPVKEEHVILVRLSPLQRALYTEFMSRFREAGNSGWLSLNPLKAFCVCCKIWNHPDVLYEALQKENLASEQDLDLDDITTNQAAARCPAPQPKGKAPSEVASSMGGLSLTALQEKANQVISYEWAKDIMADYEPGILENSAKMVLLFHLIDESVRNGDKILVFSQSLSTLSVIEEFLAKRQIPDNKYSTPGQTWVRNANYYRLDGSTSASERERLINQFNDPANTSALVFLLSTRAGCLGVNLIGANRVVVFDASWNPCHDAQAVCRVYRYGQRKQCHIYRLVCDFTLEKKIYDRQISKQGMSDRVVDDMNPVLTFTRREVESLLHFVEEEPEPAESAKLLQPGEDMELVIKHACQRYPHLITKQPFHHESLLIDRRDLRLTKSEKKAAKKGYEEEKRASVPYTRPSYAHYYPASDQSLTNIPAFSQRNWRPPARTEEKPLASVRPVQSTPVPMMPRPATQGSAPAPAPNFPVNHLQKAGVLVQKIVTTTDMFIPGTNSTKDTQTRISAGESIHVIRGTKGTYIRTSDGRIFAVRAAGKPKQPGDGDAATAKAAAHPDKEALSGAMNGSGSPDRKRAAAADGASGDLLPRPLSPDGPEILSELQCLMKPQQPTATPGATQENGAGDGAPLVKPVPVPQKHTTQSDDDQDASAPLDLRGGGGGGGASKRKRSPPAAEKSEADQPSAAKRSSGLLQPPVYPFGAGPYGLNPALNPALNPSLLGPMCHPLFMGPGSPYAPLADPRLMFPMGPDPFASSPSPCSSSSSSTSSLSTTNTKTTPSFSSSSLSGYTPSTSPPTSTSTNTNTTDSHPSIPPFLLRPGMVGMLPPGFPLPYGQALGMYPSSLLPGGLPAATPGPAGTSFLSRFPSSNPLGPALNNTPPLGGDNDSSSSSNGSRDGAGHMDERDDDVIEVMGQ
ncbi:helicase ARIP4-like isoform X2 [Engraulis encrasicolus]|uniref:helicase ARIP4-like isoform X2 n=1 Tax=Engraulis encrasicolus TaxID=184585 RepID=UPI002FD73C91